MLKNYRKIERLCIVCRKKKSKEDLIRITKTPDGLVKIDLFKKLPGRGAYICSTIDCVRKLKKEDSLAYALKTRINREQFAEIKRELESLLERGDVKGESL
jgi:predicted RNA-binding protein YlxR (DUF448 family)